MKTDSNTVTGTGRTIKASKFKARCLKLMDDIVEPMPAEWFEHGDIQNPS